MVWTTVENHGGISTPKNEVEMRNLKDVIARNDMTRSGKK